MIHIDFFLRNILIPGHIISIGLNSRVYDDKNECLTAL